MNNQRLLEEEKAVLARLIYRSKNQHSPSLVFRRMTHLHRQLRMLNNGRIGHSTKEGILESAQRLYIACSSDLVMGFFMPLNICTMSVAARIFYLVRKCPSGRDRRPCDGIEDQIDLIFDGG